MFVDGGELTLDPHVAFAARASRRKAEETDWKICEEELQIALALTMSKPEPQPEPMPTNNKESQMEDLFEMIISNDDMPRKVVEDECRVCYDGVSDHCLVPCGHTGLCESCALRMKNCPFCKMEIVHAQKMWKV
jgi:hypothetical protein